MRQCTYLSSPYVNGKGGWGENGIAGSVYVISPSKFVVLSWAVPSYDLLIFEH
jgi:hypothetical protein